MTSSVQHGSLSSKGRLQLEFGPKKKIINVRVHHWLSGLILSLLGRAIKLRVKTGAGAKEKTFFVNKRSLVIRSFTASEAKCKTDKITKKSVQ